MNQEKLSDNDEVNPDEQRSISHPTINWNRAGRGGIRTSLRGSRLPAASDDLSLTISQSQTKAFNDDSRAPVVTSELESTSTLNMSSNPKFRELAPVDHATEAATEAVPNGSNESEIPEHDLSISPGVIKSGAVSKNLMDAPEAKISAVDDSNEVNLFTSGKQGARSDTQKCRLCISNAPDTITEEDVWTLFNELNITAKRIKHIPGQPDSEIYIDVFDPSEAQHAINNLHGKEVGGRQLHVQFLPDKIAGVVQYLPTISTEEPAMTWHEFPQSPIGSQRSDASKVSLIHDSETDTEEGEISDNSDGYESNHQDFVADRYSAQDSAECATKEIIVIDSDEDDAMITSYADARQAARPSDAINLNHKVEVIDIEAVNDMEELDEQKASSNLFGPQTLAELTTAELELQVRYFYITRDPATIPETDPVRCLVCAGVGHLESRCPAQMCSHCNTKGTHFSKDCPKIARCSRCRGRHPISKCKHKLRPQNLRIICDLCNEKDHLEVDCELNWRSSGPIWRKPLPALSVARTCFICGDSGHLGNDCRLRQPGKQMGSSMWSEKGLPMPLTSLTSSIGKDSSMLLNNKKKHKMPNSRAKGVTGAHAKSVGRARSPISSLDTSDTQGWPELIKSAKDRKGPVNIQIKGLASRSNLNSRVQSDTYSPVQSSPQYRDLRENQNPNYHSGYSSNFAQSDRYYPGDSQGEFPRGRFGNSRYRSRSRSRSRSPRRWYRSPPRAVSYNTAPRDYRDRDNPNFSSAGNQWRSIGR
ncbi:MAG: hypothetical protein GOMPHAMPRED_002060 [Gomphillus americanus]|uniref:Uncharacterized protein n=1 Tax=Gomphillus americanus TaxID=1940652 RepID=A0A8H3F9P9_9LECA|nr:MAG: hypothetical protein GOMPHAMPRED_002060 [Gomphillus americanus]